MSSPPARRSREIYIDAFRGLMALVMVQGHVCDALLDPLARALPLYQFQGSFHGSTAPGFLFASGFVAGLPRAPLSLRASLRRARRLLFVLGVGYALHLPYFSLQKTLAASAAEQAALFACDALQAIAVTQLAVLGLQWLFRERWVGVAAALAGLVLVLGPFVWAAQLARAWPAPLAAYLDVSTGSHFPLFPFASFVLLGTVAGALLGRTDPAQRHRRALVSGLGLLGAGALLALLLLGRVDFWGVSPGYALLRLGALVLLLRLVERSAERGWPGIEALALLGRESLLVFVLHLVVVWGGVLVPDTPLQAWHGRLSFGGAALVLLALLPGLWAAAFLWHRSKARWPHEAQALLVLLATWFCWEFATRPW